jgi:excisionase family DNA binding protein
MEKPEIEQWVDVNAAASFLGIQLQTLRLWCLQRRIPFGRAGSRLRFKLSELDAMVTKAGERPHVD